MKRRLVTTMIAFAFVGSLAGSTIAQSSAATETTAPTVLVSEDDKHEHPPGFESDGCTAFPDGNYRECCEEHDLDYYKGGSFSQRRASDKRLYRCVKAKGGWKNDIRAPMMYLGVRVFGAAWLPTSFRWGFGKKEIKRAEEESEKEAAKESRSKTETDIKKENTDETDPPSDSVQKD